MSFDNIFLTFENKMIENGGEYYLSFYNKCLNVVLDNDTGKRGVFYDDYLNKNNEVLMFKLKYEDGKFSIIENEDFVLTLMKDVTGFDNINDLLKTTLIDQISLQTENKLVKTDILMFSVDFCEKAVLNKQKKSIHENKSCEEILKGKYNIFVKDLKAKSIESTKELTDRVLAALEENKTPEAMAEARSFLKDYVTIGLYKLNSSFENSYTDAVFIKSYNLFDEEIKRLVDKFVDEVRDTGKSEGLDFNEFFDKIFYSFYRTAYISETLGVDQIFVEGVKVLKDNEMLMAKNKKRLDALLFDIPEPVLKNNTNKKSM